MSVTSWARLTVNGLQPLQAGLLPLYESTRTFRAYSSWLVPGTLQTRPYIRSVFTALRHRYASINDIDAAIEARIARQALMGQGGRRFHFLLEESVLRNCVAGTDVMAQQLEHLLTVGNIPGVDFGVLPTGCNRPWPTESYWIYDDRSVNVELVASELSVSDSEQVGRYVASFDALASRAVHGEQAREMVHAARHALAAE